MAVRSDRTKSLLKYEPCTRQLFRGKIPLWQQHWILQLNLPKCGMRFTLNINKKRPWNGATDTLNNHGQKGKTYQDWGEKLLNDLEQFLTNALWWPWGLGQGDETLVMDIAGMSQRDDYKNVHLTTRWDLCRRSWHPSVIDNNCVIHGPSEKLRPLASLGRWKLEQLDASYQWSCGVSIWSFITILSQKDSGF